MNTDLKKNIMDLNYQKYLIIASTSIVLLFTYTVGIIIAFLSGQLKFTLINSFVMFILALFIIITTSYFLFSSIREIKRIPRIIEKL